MSWTNARETSLPLEPGPHHLPAHDDSWWSAVRIGRVDVHRRGDADDAATVRARIELGALAPADVRVEMVTEDASAADDRAVDCVRLWSTQSYDNGTFVFEARVPAELVRARDAISVRVRPAPAGAVRDSLRPIVRRCELDLDIAAPRVVGRGSIARPGSERRDAGDAARA